MSVTISGTAGVTFNDGSSQNTSAYGGGFAMRNRIINGAMVIDQRNAGASTNNAGGALTYSLDRWSYFGSGSSKFSIQQNAGSVTPPSGFKNYLGVTSLAATTVASTDLYLLQQPIEGLNTYDLDWGTANAKTVTLSFWVRSSLTGTFGGSLVNSSLNRSYPFSYTISTANTWEYETITIAGDQSGTWLTTNDIGIRVYFGLGIGSTYSGTAGAWAGADYRSATGATNVVGTNGATFYITGVQLEKGSTATSFDYRPYGTELALCQRYTIKWGGNTTFETFGAGQALSTTAAWVSLVFPVEMRAVPSLDSFSNLALNNSVGGQLAVTSMTIGYTGTKVAGLLPNAASGMTAGNATLLMANGSTSAKILLSAEL
jgi:hypothetical protein